MPRALLHMSRRLLGSRVGVQRVLGVVLRVADLVFHIGPNIVSASGGAGKREHSESEHRAEDQTLHRAAPRVETKSCTTDSATVRSFTITTAIFKKVAARD